MQYSGFYDSVLASLLRGARIDEVYLVGINTDFCVLATALDALYLRFDTRVVADAVTSVNGAAGPARGLEMLRQYFGPLGVLVNSTDIPPLLVEAQQSNDD